MSDPNLPPGVTDEMCEGGPVQVCGNCGHFKEHHLEEGDEPCDYKECECPGFVEDEYEPEINEDEMKGL